MTREEKIREARRLRAERWTAAAIGRELAVPASTVRNWYLGGDCQECGAPVEGSSSRRAQFCVPCYNRLREPEHGTVSRYNGGCRCDECREALRLYMASLKGRPAPSHGLSGYTNYGCRCDICRAAHSERMRSPKFKAIKRAWVEKVRGTEPPRHGTLVAYGNYRCRCAECRAANTAYARAWRAKKKAAA